MKPFGGYHILTASSVAIALDELSHEAPPLGPGERYELVLHLDQRTLIGCVVNTADRVKRLDEARARAQQVRDAEAATVTPQHPVAACPAGGEDFVSRAYAALRAFGKR